MRRINLLGFSMGKDANNRLIKAKSSGGELGHSDKGQGVEDQIIKAKQPAGEERWITVNGRHILINSSTGDVVQGGGGMAGGKDLKKIDGGSVKDDRSEESGPSEKDLAAIEFENTYSKEEAKKYAEGGVPIPKTEEKILNSITEEDIQDFKNKTSNKEEFLDEIINSKFGDGEIPGEKQIIEALSKRYDGDGGSSNSGGEEISKSQTQDLEKGLESLSDEEIEILQTIAEAILENLGDDWDGEGEMFDEKTSQIIQGLKDKGMIHLNNKGCSLTKQGAQTFKSLLSSGPKDKEAEEKVDELNELAQDEDLIKSSHDEDEEDENIDSLEDLEDGDGDGDDNVLDLEDDDSEGLDGDDGDVNLDPDNDEGDDGADNSLSNMGDDDDGENVGNLDIDQDDEGDDDEDNGLGDQNANLDDKDGEEAPSGQDQDLQEEGISTSDQDETNLGDQDEGEDFVDDLRDAEQGMSEEEDERENDFTPQELATHAANTASEDLKKFIAQSNNEAFIAVAKKELQKRGELSGDGGPQDQEKQFNEWLDNHLDDYDREDLQDMAIEMILETPKELKIMKNLYRDAYAKENDGNKLKRVDLNEMKEWAFDYLSGQPEEHVKKYVKELAEQNPDRKAKFFKSFQKSLQ